MHDYDKMRSTQNAVHVASQIHFDLLTIQPFKDGNGQTARLVQNLHLVQERYVPILIGPSEKDTSTKILRKAQTEIPVIGNPRPFAQYMIDLEIVAMRRYYNVLKNSHGRPTRPWDEDTLYDIEIEES
jgi:fido (protein-threonine AMPylation protein)